MPTALLSGRWHRHRSTTRRPNSQHPLPWEFNQSSAFCVMASLSVRKIEWGCDYDRLYLSLTRLVLELRERPSKLMHRIIDTDAAMEHLTTQADPDGLWMVNGYFVYFEVHQPWYAYHSILSELLIVRVEDTGGTLAGVAHFLRDRARAAGAAFAVAGTALARNDAALARLYRSGGFTPEATTLTAEA